jgi:hypothetical protein
MYLEMELNQDQQKVFEELDDFVFNKSKKNKLFLLTGFAGTGKTTLIAHFMTSPKLNTYKIALTGCTNKAVGVLESSFLKMNSNNVGDKMIDFLTIHKLLQIKRKIDLNGEELFVSTIDENNVQIKAKSIFYYDLIIIDEVSMLNRDITLQLLELQKKIKGKIIFLGDKGQLPPVKESESHIFELGNTNIPHGKLHKIMRSGDQLINFVNSIRKLIDDPLHKVPFKKLSMSLNDDPSRIGLHRKFDEWVKKYLDNTDNTEQIILCYTNKRVEFLNKYIRKILYKTDKMNYIDGEKIIFNNAYHLATNENKYDSSQMVIIKSSILDKINIRKFNLYDILNFRFPIAAIDPNAQTLRKKYKVPELSLLAYEIENGTVRISDSACMICYNDLISEDYEHLELKRCTNNLELYYNQCGHHYCMKCCQLYETRGSKCPLCLIKIKEGRIVIESDPHLGKMINTLRETPKNANYAIWLIMLHNKDLLHVIHQDEKIKYEQDIENIKTQLRDINSYISSNGKKRDQILEKIVQQLWEFYYYYYIDQFAQINYGNAITTHRSQGSTYKNVYVDLIDIITYNDIKKEGYQCLYTAVTRAAENLEILY